MRKAKDECGDEILAMQDDDLRRLGEVFLAVSAAWREDLVASGGDKGTCVLGAGLAIPYVAKGFRIACWKVVVSPPGQADCGWCVARAQSMLQAALGGGIKVMFKYGWAD